MINKQIRKSEIHNRELDIPNLTSYKFVENSLEVTLLNFDYIYVY